MKWRRRREIERMKRIEPIRSNIKEGINQIQMVLFTMNR